jgi:hypothetical protein
LKKDTTNAPADVADKKLFDNWFDPIETKLRTKVRSFMEAMIEEEFGSCPSALRAPIGATGGRRWGRADCRP